MQYSSVHRVVGGEFPGLFREREVLILIALDSIGTPVEVAVQAASSWTTGACSPAIVHAVFSRQTTVGQTAIFCSRVFLRTPDSRACIGEKALRPSGPFLGRLTDII